MKSESNETATRMAVTLTVEELDRHIEAAVQRANADLLRKLEKRPEGESEIITIDEAARMLRACTRTVRSWASLGYVKAVKLGPGRTSRLYITRASIDQFLSEAGAR